MPGAGESCTPLADITCNLAQMCRSACQKLFIPQFILFAKLPAFGFQGSENWVNTFLPLTVPAFTGSAFYIFLLRQFMRGIPIELFEAARIDGASELCIWSSIVMPLTKAALAAIAIFTFHGAWEDFMGPLIYLQREELYTLQLGLRKHLSVKHIQ